MLKPIKNKKYSYNERKKELYKGNPPNKVFWSSKLGKVNWALKHYRDDISYFFQTFYFRFLNCLKFSIIFYVDF